MIVKLLTEHHLEFLCLKGGYKGSSESTLVQMSNCWKSHALAQLLINANSLDSDQGGTNENYIRHLIEYLTSQKTRMTLLSSADFFRKFLSGSNGLDPETACKGYQQTR